ncbi:MAG: zinc ribbon domain-containing protein [Bacteroidetes bacterium]|nr:zinc ribbon domain-containing protein [Bacteroidota bacterium]
MPTYDYKCSECGHLFETMQSMKDAPLTTCPNCGKETLNRLIGAGGGMIFKGSGFYLTDYKGGSGSGSSSSAPSPKSDAKPAAPAAGSSAEKT